MQIKSNLNLVIPIESSEGGQMFVHSTPIARSVFEEYHLVIAKTFASFFKEEVGVISSPRIAHLMLKDTAKKMGVWEGETGVKAGLYNEIIRLTNVILIGDDGWKTIPLQVAISKKMIDEDEISEIEGELIFFTCASKIHKRAQALSTLEAATGLWGSQITSLSCTEFRDFCVTSTEAESSGETEITLLANA